MKVLSTLSKHDVAPLTNNPSNMNSQSQIQNSYQQIATIVLLQALWALRFHAMDEQNTLSANSSERWHAAGLIQVLCACVVVGDACSR